MAWQWSGDKPLSGPTSDNYLYHFTNSDLLYIWCPWVDAISLITQSPLHSKGNHSPHGLYTQLSEIHNFGVKLITGLCQLIWTVTPRGYANIGNLYMGKTASLYWKPCPNNQTFGIKFNVTVRKRSIRVKIGNFLSRVILKFDRWPWKTIGHFSNAPSSVVHLFIAIGEFKLELQSGNAQFGSKSTIFLSVRPLNLTTDLEKQ